VNDRPMPIARIELPDDWEPENIVCARVPVPDHPAFRSMLVGLVDMFRWSQLYRRDDTREGAATVSRTWERALASQPIEFEDCMDNCCDDPVINPPPYPGSPDPGGSAAGAALQNIYIHTMEVAGDCSISRADFINEMTAYFRLGDATFSNPIALGQLYDAWCLLEPGEQDEALDECNYIDKRDELGSCYDAGGLIVDLNCISETITGWLNTASDELQRTLAAVAGSLGLGGWQAFSNGSFSGGGGGAGGGGGFGSQCGWCHEFDFTTDPYDTGNPVNITQYFGTYSAGVGYVSTPDDQLDIRFEFGGIYEITFMEIDYLTTGSAHNDGEYFRVNTQHGTFVGGPLNAYGPAGLEHLIHNGSGTMGDGHAAVATGFVQVQFIPGPVGTGTQTVARWKVCGVGDDPFI